MNEKSFVHSALWLSNIHSQKIFKYFSRNKTFEHQTIEEFHWFSLGIKLNRNTWNTSHNVESPSRVSTSIHSSFNKYLFLSRTWFGQVVHVIQMRNEFPVSLISSPVNKLEITQRRFLRAHDTFAVFPWHFIWTTENKVFGRNYYMIRTTKSYKSDS